MDGDGTPSTACRDDTDTPGIDGVGGWTPIDGVSTATYTPQPPDVDKCLRAAAVYRDNIDYAVDRAVGVTEAPAQSSKVANAAP